MADVRASPDCRGLSISTRSSVKVCWTLVEATGGIRRAYSVFRIYVAQDDLCPAAPARGTAPAPQAAQPRPRHAAGARHGRDRGQTLTLGDTTLTFTLTPGHTPGTVSTLIPVKDNGTPHLVAEWGGTLIGGLRTPEGFQTYINSAERFRDIVAKDAVQRYLTVADECAKAGLAALTSSQTSAPPR